MLGVGGAGFGAGAVGARPPHEPVLECEEPRLLGVSDAAVLVGIAELRGHFDGVVVERDGGRDSDRVGGTDEALEDVDHFVGADDALMSGQGAEKRLLVVQRPQRLPVALGVCLGDSFKQNKRPWPVLSRETLQIRKRQWTRESVPRLLACQSSRLSARPVAAFAGEYAAVTRPAVDLRA